MLRPGIRRAFRLAVRRRDRLAGDVREEVEHHLAASVEWLVARGLSPEAARAEALRRLGPDVHQRLYAAARRREDRMRTFEWIEDLGADLRYALRQLRRAPGFAAAVVATFALGIGANATAFGLVDRLLLRGPAHVAAPERVVELSARWSTPDNPLGGSQMLFGYQTYEALRDRLAASGVATDVGAATAEPLDLSVGRGERAWGARGALVSGSYFALLGVRAELGRFFRPDEDVKPLGAPVAVISHGLWRRTFGGSAAALGRELEIGARRYTIVGVAPERFTGVHSGAVDVWLPITSAEGLRPGGAAWAATVSTTWLRVFARLAPGATAAQVAGRATAIHTEAGEPRLAQLGATIRAIPLPAAMRGEGYGPARAYERRTAGVAALLGAMSALVLVIACANVAGLLLARALDRRREIAVRLALGTRAGRLVRQLLTESLLLSTLGGAAALVAAWWGASLLRTLLFGDLHWEDAPLDARTLAFTGAVTAITGLLAGLVPALKAARPSLAGTLVAASRRATERRPRARSALLVLQAALATVLLVGTGLFVRSLRNLHALPLGIEPERVLLASMDLRPLGPTAVEADALFRRMEERVRALPEVRSAALAATVPGEGSFAEPVFLPGRDSIAKRVGRGPYVNYVRPGYLGTIGTRLLRGRELTDAEERTNAPVAVVNETLARYAWPGGDALGKCLKVGSDTAPCREVIGVAENSRRQDWVEEENFHIHLPLAQAPAWATRRVLVVRPAGADPERAIPAVRRALQDAAPGLPYTEVRPYEGVFANELRPWRIGAALFGLFGALAAVLVAVGLYGVIAFSVAQRTRELGVRIALGARAAGVLALVLRQGVLLAAAGGAIGLVVALGAARLVEPLLFRVPARDPAVLAGVALALLAVAAAATLVPAWRATRVDPAVALRDG